MKKIILLLVLSVAAATGTVAQNKNEQLYAAVVDNDQGKVEKLLRQKADPNYVKAVGPWMKVSLLITAVNNGSLEMVKLLVDMQAQVDWRDGFNSTALMYAAAKGRKEIVELLLASGADVRAHDGQGNSVLSAAKESKNREVIVLIESKLKQ